MPLLIFFAKADTKNHRFASAKSSNAALVKLTDWIIKNDHVINCVLFSVSDKHGQTNNVILLSTAWILLFQLEVANEKPLFTKPATIWIEITCSKDLIFHSYKVLYPNPGYYIGMMLFTSKSKVIRTWFVTLQADIF